MKATIGKIGIVLWVISLVFGLGLGSAQAQQEVTVNGTKIPLEILETVYSEFNNPDNPELQQLQFRGLNLTRDEALKLFLSTDMDLDENLLRSIGNTIQNEQQVKFRGTVDGNSFETLVEREGDGSLRLRIEGMDVASLTPEQIGDFLSNGFDRVRIRGLGGERFDIRRQDDGSLRAEIRGMNLVGLTLEQLTNLAIDNGFARMRIRGTKNERFDIKRQDDGTLRVEIKGMDFNNLNLEQLTSFAVENGFERLRINGTDGQRFRIDRKDDGSLRVDIRGIDVSGITSEQLANLAMEKGLERLRIRGLKDERFEINRQNNGTLRARIERMDFSNRDPKELLSSLREKGLDRVRIRGVDAEGNRVRIEYRQDKGIVKWEGVGRGLTELSRDLNNELARDRGRDWEKKLRNRVDRERERFDRADHGRRGRDRIERSLRDRAEHVRERLERHGGSGRH